MRPLKICRKCLMNQTKKKWLAGIKLVSQIYKVIIMTQEEHDRKILIERAAVEELLLKEHISVPAAYERVREYVDRFEKESKLEISNDY